MNAIDILRKLVSIPSFSGEEAGRADFLTRLLEAQGIAVTRTGNNLLARIDCAGADAPVIMLNSHLDTVRPSASYTFDPSRPPHDNALIRGLGSNDAGGAVVSMMAAALHFHHHKNLKFNILLLLSAEEEISGPGGMPLAIAGAGKVDCAIIGEPTSMKAAVGERGLLVLDGVARGVSGHAARGEGKNAIYTALDDIAMLRDYRFADISPLMGEVKISVTQIAAGSQHNVIPDECRFVVDVRPTDIYSNSRILSDLQKTVKSVLTPRPPGHPALATPCGHPLLECVRKLGIETLISPTASDWAGIGSIPAIKMGPGDSSRSHTADEYITVAEIQNGIAGYIDFLTNL